MSLDEDRELLRDVLGERLADWIAATENPGESVRIGSAAEVVPIFLATYDRTTALAWLWGTCVLLDDRNPVVVLRSSTSRAEADQVVAAARSFTNDPGYK